MATRSRSSRRRPRVRDQRATRAARPRRAAYPDAIEAAYVAELRALVDRMELAATPVVVSAYERAGGRTDNENPASPTPPENPFTTTFGRVRVVFGNVIDDPRGTVAKTGQQLSLFNLGQHNKLLNVVQGINPLTEEPWLDPLMAAWTRANTNLIVSLPVSALDRVERAVSDAWRRGLSTRDLQAQLRDAFGVTKRRAELIARDQTGKLNGQLTALRQAASGVERYKWRTARDPRVREHHAQREGDIFEWAHPPDDGHPGQPIQCRCWSEPVLDDLLSDDGLESIGTPEHAVRVHRQLGVAVNTLLEGGFPDGRDLLEETRDAIMGSLPSVATIRRSLQSGRPMARSRRKPRVPRVRRVQTPPAAPPTPAPVSPAAPAMSPATPPAVPPMPVATVFVPATTLEEGVQRLFTEHEALYGDPSVAGVTYPASISRWGSRLTKAQRLVQVNYILEALHGLRGTAFENLGRRVLWLPRRAPRGANGQAIVGRLLDGPAGAQFGMVAINPKAKFNPKSTWSSFHRAPTAELKVHHTIRHELAHVNTTPDIVKRWRALPVDYDAAWFRDNVSGYSGTYRGFFPDIDEQIAESFAWYTSPGYVAGSLPEPIEEILATMTGPSATSAQVAAALTPKTEMQSPPPGMKWVFMPGPEDDGLEDAGARLVPESWRPGDPLPPISE